MEYVSGSEKHALGGKGIGEGIMHQLSHNSIGNAQTVTVQAHTRQITQHIILFRDISYRPRREKTGLQCF